MSAEMSPERRRMLFVTGEPVEGGLVTPCGEVASCCCCRPLLKRSTLPLVKLFLGKLSVSVHSCSVGLLGVGFDGGGAGLLRGRATLGGGGPCGVFPEG